MKKKKAKGTKSVSLKESLNLEIMKIIQKKLKFKINQALRQKNTIN